MLFADIEVSGEVAFVDDQRLSRGTRATAGGV